MPDLQVTVHGLADLEKALSQLPDNLAKNALRGAVRAGAKVIAEEAQRQAPVRTGRLRDSIRYSSGVRAGVPKAKVVAGGRRGGKKNAGKAAVFYAPMVEFGTAKHMIIAGPGKALPLGGGRKFARHPGAQRKPFMRPAADLKMQEATLAAANYLRERLAKAGVDVPDPSPDDLEE